MSSDRYFHHRMIPDRQVFWFLHGLIKNSRDLTYIAAVCAQMRDVLDRNQNEADGDGSFDATTWYQAVHMLKLFDPYSARNKDLEAPYFDDDIPF